MGAIRRVWITRAEPGAGRTADRLQALGFEPIVAPLLAIRRLAPTLDLTGFAALVFTSMNGVAAFAAPSSVRTLPVFTVGDTTAAAARAEGFADVRSAAGDLAALADLIRASNLEGPLLHPAAREPAGDLAALLPPTITVRTVAVYETVETDTRAPDGFDGVLFHSPRAARVFALRHRDQTASRVAVAISSAAAAPVTDLGFAELRTASHPAEASLIAALGKPAGPV